MKNTVRSQNLPRTRRYNPRPIRAKMLIKSRTAKPKKIQRAAMVVNMMNKGRRFGVMRERIGSGIIKRIRRLMKKAFHTTPTQRIY
jgi:hypothetical protein